MGLVSVTLLTGGRHTVPERPNHRKNSGDIGACHIASFHEKSGFIHLFIERSYGMTVR
jgi:hypothetical protein